MGVEDDTNEGDIDVMGLNILLAERTIDIGPRAKEAFVEEASHTKEVP